MKKPRLLNADEIEVRVQAIYPKYVSLLLYIKGAAIIKLLDETFGYLNWQKKHVMYGDVMFCELLVRDPENPKEWISRQDLGSPSFSEPQKGAATDGLKRAGKLFSISNELGTIGPINVKRERVEVYENNGKPTVKDKFHVQSIKYDEVNRVITGIVIANQRGEVVYQYFEEGNKKVIMDNDRITTEQTALLLEELKRTGISLTSVLKKHNLNKISDMNTALYEKAISALKDVETKAA